MTLYCDKWIAAERRPINPLDESEALNRHKSRTPYTAVLGPVDEPTHLVVVAPPWVKVTFLDEYLREYLRYDFKKIEQQKVFLAAATHREYRGETREVVGAKLFRFHLDGSILMEEHDLVESTVVQKRTTFDPAANWEAYPAFGNYASLCKRDR